MSDPKGLTVEEAETRRWQLGRGEVYEAMNALHASHEALRAQVETLDLKLAACMTAALGNTPEAVAQRIPREHPYWSASYGDVCAAVDREMALRARVEATVQFVNDEIAVHSTPTSKEPGSLSAVALIAYRNVLARLTAPMEEHDQS